MLGERILSAAADELVRYGYAKTTLDAVARAAGVAKGTLYLRWRTREDLFVAVLRRERAAMQAEILAELGDEPADLRALLVAQVRASCRRNLMSALMLRDADVLGGLARAAEERGLATSGFVGYLVALREQKLIDTERTLAEQATVVSSMFIGYFTSAPMIPSSLQVDGCAAELVAETIHRMLVRPEPLTPAEQAAMDATTRAYATFDEEHP
ncbi:TetR/AcrR family transcriptional regulator [Pseudonocardia sp. CA-107938]|uniref:TetR/AcrR family transcriptional regulator n=1 Tax=Pseudonocardia sp. CA-107938 TaxID=3240021 RepID=UPI003D8D1BA0